MEISETAIIALLGIALVAALILFVLFRQRRTAALRDRFGEDEYDRTLGAKGARGKAEAELLEREKRVKKLHIRPLTSDERETFTNDWNTARLGFVDDPAAAVGDADRTLGRIMGARGFPVSDFDEMHDTLTVDHGEVARHYRAGHDLALKQDRGEASTEDLRQAMIHYEALFAELVDDVVPEESDGTRQVQRQT